MISASIVSGWPGKTIEGRFHPALWHMLDVGAVADALISSAPLSASTRLDRALVFLITLHDIGKFSEAFRKQILGRAAPAEYHSQLGFELLGIHDALLEKCLGGTSKVREELSAAVAGHHGGPPELDGGQGLQRARWEAAIGSAGIEVAAKVIETVTDLFPSASLDGLTTREAEALSWRLSGLTIQSDWIGSNSTWFGPEPPDVSVSDYWLGAQEKASRAISEAGLDISRPRRGAGLFNSLARPRPMQEAVMAAELPDGPAMALIEDATGAGKTEAALLLASRIIQSGQARGLFFALPTMATSNAMLARLERASGKLFDGRVSLGLSHGRAKENELFKRIIGNDGSDPGEPATCGQWLADDRRRILLADMGVGTIDQALLAVLPTRFNTLRLWALSNRVLIVDEAHSYDSYMEEILCQLLRFQAMLGGSAIVMTATLPKALRARLVGAFQKGLGIRKPDACTGEAYPQLSVIGQEVSVTAPKPVPATCRTIRVSRIDEAGALELIAKGADAGGACVWIRNAVDDAIDACKTLRARGIDAELLHARFTVEDRLAKERALQARFGKGGGDRAGRVLVATQVVEASLDLDFDLMISDLAPIGALIQRGGRLWRHMEDRPAETRPVEGPALHIVSPDPAEVADPRWLHRVQPRGARVYPLADQWRTAREVFSVGEIRAPEGLRPLIEAVHGPDAAEVPKVFEDAELRDEREVKCDRASARELVLAQSSFLKAAQTVRNEDRVLTRLGIPQVTLWLARASDTGLVPFGESWEGSEVRMSRARFEELGGVDQNAPEIAMLKAGWPEWKVASVIVAPVKACGEITNQLKYDGILGLLASS